MVQYIAMRRQRVAALIDLVEFAVAALVNQEVVLLGYLLPRLVQLG